MVGCVIVQGDAVVGEGWHESAGGPHAEVNALSAAGSDAHGATVYVSLEPCAHSGKTPPCCDALIAAGVTRVIAAMSDPFSAVDGEGFAALRSAGVDVKTGLLEVDARALNRGFVSRIERGRPFLTLKIAASLDGATAMANGQSQWITGPAARDDVQRLRAASGAILTGVGTILSDDPSLNVRLEDRKRRPPLRAVVDSRLRTPTDARVLQIEGQTALFCIEGTTRDAGWPDGAEIIGVAEEHGRVALGGVLEVLGARGINDVLAECGPTLAGALLAGGWVDELVIYQSPHIMGSETRGMVETPAWTALTDRCELEIIDVRRVGKDTRITARPV